jgi:hypothetical protein
MTALLATLSSDSQRLEIPRASSRDAHRKPDAVNAALLRFLAQPPSADEARDRG